MGKLKLALCIEDREYQNRFTNCIMNHYQNQFELHVFTREEEFEEGAEANYHGIIFSGYRRLLDDFMERPHENLVYLYDEEIESVIPEDGITYVDKYQEVNRIIEVVLSKVKEEVRQVRTTGNLALKTRFIGIYSLAQKEQQIAISLTVASILSEREKVLFLDLQSNSGLSQLTQKESTTGLEELLVMAESGKYSRNRIMTGIGKMDHIDYVYPAKNTDRMSETVAATYLKLLQMLSNELDYSVIVINLGVRFVGFFELMNRCKQVLFLGKSDELSRWRELEFMEELRSKGYEILAQRIQRLQVPQGAITTGCERPVEQWKWNGVGEHIRGALVTEEIIA